MSLQSIIVHILLLIIFFFVLKRIKYVNKALQFLYVQLAFSAIIQFSFTLMRFSNFHNNLPILHFAVPIDFLLISLFFRHMLKNHIKPIYFDITTVLFITFSVINTLFIQSLFEFNNYVRSIGGLILAVYAILFFLNKLNNPKSSIKTDTYITWIVSSILIYFSGCFFIFIMGNIILQYSVEWSSLSWQIHIYLLLLYNTMMLYSLIMIRSTNKNIVK